MTKTLELAMQKVQNLSEETQEAIGQELLVRVLEIEEMRKAVAVGLEQADRGEVTQFDMKDLLEELHREYGEQ